MRLTVNTTLKHKKILDNELKMIYFLDMLNIFKPLIFVCVHLKLPH